MPQGQLWLGTQPLILASTSATRLKLLQDISIPVEAVGSQVDERAIENTLQKEKTHPTQIALALADAKAREVARRFPTRARKTTRKVSGRHQENHKAHSKRQSLHLRRRAYAAGDRTRNRTPDWPRQAFRQP